MKTVAEVKTYCMKHYNDGLDVIVECWTDADIQQMIDRGNPMEELKTLASVVNEERAAAKYFSGEDDEDWEEPYVPSSTRGDYSPSNPWDAPGMSIHDFI